MKNTAKNTSDDLLYFCATKFMQQLTSPLLEGESSVCIYYPLQSTYLINCSKVTASGSA